MRLQQSQLSKFIFTENEDRGMDFVPCFFMATLERKNDLSNQPTQQTYKYVTCKYSIGGKIRTYPLISTNTTYALVKT